MSAQIDTLNEDNKRRGRDRRRYGMSMIHNYAEYCGPERRSGEDRRYPVRQQAHIVSTAYAV